MQYTEEVACYLQLSPALLDPGAETSVFADSQARTFHSSLPTPDES